MLGPATLADLPRSENTRNLNASFGIAVSLASVLPVPGALSKVARHASSCSSSWSDCLGGRFSLRAQCLAPAFGSMPSVPAISPSDASCAAASVSNHSGSSGTAAAACIGLAQKRIQLERAAAAAASTKRELARTSMRASSNQVRTALSIRTLSDGRTAISNHASTRRAARTTPPTGIDARECRSPRVPCTSAVQYN